MKKIILAVTLLALTAGITMGADMIAGNPKNGANVVGTVDVSTTATDLVVTYTITDLDWIITETHLEIATDPGDFPTSKGGAIPGHFTYSTSHDLEDNMQVVIHTIPLDEVFPPDGIVPDVFYVAAHAVVGTLCPCEDITPECMPDEVMINVVSAYLDFEPDYENSYFIATVSAVEGGDDCLNGEYDAWCVDTDRSISPIGLDEYGDREYKQRPVPQKAGVYLSTEWDPLDLPTPLIENYGNLPLVNWILNNISVGDISGCGDPLEPYTFGDIQKAIWELLNNDTDEHGLGPYYSPCRVLEIITMAEAEGEGFEPICTENVGLILLPYVYVYPEGHAMAGQVIKDESTANGYPDTGYPDYPGDPIYPGDPAWPVDVVGVIKYQQPIMIMVPVPCCFCDETAWAGTPMDPSPLWPDEDNDGYRYEFPGKDWSMYFSIPEEAVIAELETVKVKKK